LCFWKFKFKKPIYYAFCIAIAVGFITSCSPEHYKAEADKEVYGIIDSKWQNSFGSKANYIISDCNTISSPNDIRIEKAVPVSGKLSLAYAVEIATARNRSYQRQKDDLYLIALDATLARHQFARQWFGTIDAQYVRDRYDESVSSESGFGFDQLLADGAVISTGIAIDWARFLTGDPQTSLGSVLSASITQPLLRGRGRRIVEENLTQAERDVLYQIRAFNRYRKTFVVSIVSAYYRVLQRRDVVTNAENNYNSSVESSKRLEMEGRAGRKDSFEVDQAKQRELTARDNLVQVQERYKQELDEFKILLSLPTHTDIELDQNELKALEKIGVPHVDYMLDDAVETAFEQRLDLANSKDLIDDAKRKVVVAADGLGADLNLVGSAYVGSAEKTKLDRLQFNRGTYALGIEADLPLDRKVERNVYRTALIALEQRRRDYQNDVDQVELEVRQAYRQLQAAAERYETQRNSLELAKTRVESTTFLLQAGRVTTRDLLESQDALLAAQNDLTTALVDHAIAKLSFFRDIGILQVRPDGMWEQKSPRRQSDRRVNIVKSEKIWDQLNPDNRFDSYGFKESKIVLSYQNE
jgi:outer membrane protein TolC